MGGKGGERGWEGKEEREGGRERGRERVGGKKGERAWDGKGERVEGEGGARRIEEIKQLVVCLALSCLHDDHPTGSPPELDHIQTVGENDVWLSLQ